MFFKEQIKKRIKNEKGLTLIELLAVIVILAIVAAIAIPAIGNIITNSRTKAAKADVANIVSAANIYFTENAGETEFTPAVAADYVSDSGSVSTYKVIKGSPATIEAAGELNGKQYYVDTTTLKELKVDEKDTDDDKFTWGTKTVTPAP